MKNCSWVELFSHEFFLVVNFKRKKRLRKLIFFQAICFENLFRLNIKKRTKSFFNILPHQRVTGCQSCHINFTEIQNFHTKSVYKNIPYLKSVYKILQKIFWKIPTSSIFIHFQFFFSFLRFLEHVSKNIFLHYI